jgi:hypothetical protein
VPEARFVTRVQGRPSLACSLALALPASPDCLRAVLDPRAGACEKVMEDPRGTEVHPPWKSTAKPQAAATEAVPAPAAKSPAAKVLTEGQRAYEAKRAAKAGTSLEKWLTSKQRQQEAEAKAKQKAVEAAKPPKPPGFFSRLLERAQRPFGS